MQSDYPIAHVYVTHTDREGRQYITKYTAPHDGALQAANEAVRAMGLDPLPSGTRIREIEVFTNENPRRFHHEPEVVRTFGLKEANR